MSKFSKPSKDNLTFEERRLKKLRRYDILQTPPELVFDLIAEIAKSTFASAGSFVSFIDVDTVFLKANTSEIVINTLNKDESLCTVAGRTYEITLIEDTNQHNEVKNSPFVQIDNGIKFYAAAPIISAEGFILGTVSVMDIKARFDIKEEQLDVLRWLASLTMEKLEARLVSRVAVKAYDDRLHRLAHDMKNPATTLIGFGQLMSRSAISAEKIEEMGEKIEGIGRNISQTMNNLLSEAQNENATIDLKFETIKVSELIESVTRTFEFSLKNKNQTLEIHCYTDGYIQIDRERIHDVFTNMLSNAIKYSYPGSTIKIICSSEEDNVIFEFRDRGVGLTTEDLPKLFTKFARLSSIPTAKERSNGIGLYIVKTLVQLHGGKVWAASEGKEKGSSFFISLPKFESPSVSE